MAAKFKAFGIAATADNSPSGWSIPAVRMPDGTYIMDSRKIADALEELKSEPSLRLNSGYVERTQKAVLDTHQALAPTVMPRVPELLLNPVSADYFRETRKKRFGMPLSELEKSPKAGEAAWESAGPTLQALVEMLNEHNSGPFVLGEEPSYADLILAGYWAFIKRVDKNDIFERLMSYDGAFPKHWEACQIFLQHDN